MEIEIYGNLSKYIDRSLRKPYNVSIILPLVHKRSKMQNVLQVQKNQDTQDEVEER